MAFGDPEFGGLMRRLIPKVEVFPHQLLDGRAVVLRARGDIEPATLLGPAGAALGGLLRSAFVVDLFEPPQRAAYRERVAAPRESGRTERQAGEAPGLKQAAVHDAMALHRTMKEAGVTDPYRPRTAPDGDSKISRYRHTRYDFRPLDGYPAWPDAGAE